MGLNTEHSFQILLPPLLTHLSTTLPHCSAYTATTTHTLPLSLSLSLFHTALLTLSPLRNTAHAFLLIQPPLRSHRSVMTVPHCLTHTGTTGQPRSRFPLHTATTAHPSCLPHSQIVGEWPLCKLLILSSYLFESNMRKGEVNYHLKELNRTPVSVCV